MVIRLFLVFGILCGAVSAGTPRGAQAIRQNFDGKLAQWIKQYEATPGLDAKEALMKNQPNNHEAAQRMWREIYRNLDDEWSMPYAGWLLRTSPAFATKAIRGQPTENGVPVTPMLQIMNVLRQKHLNSAEIGGCSAALSFSRAPEVIRLLEEVKTKSPHKAVQGQAALGLALIQRELGQEPAIMKKRLANLTEAIVKSADIKIGTTSVAEVAQKELFEINHLIKGRVAPEMAGMNEMKREMPLSSFRGEVVVLFFWSLRMNEADRVLGIMKDFVEKRQGQKVRVVGVTSDPLAEVRKLRANETTPWSSIVDEQEDRMKTFQVRQLPYVYVLDEKGVIYYKGAPGSFVDFAVDALMAKGKKDESGTRKK